MPIICVRSSLKLGAFFLRAYDTHKDYFAETVDYENLPQVLARLQELPYDIVGVFPGCEPGVELADQIAEALKMPSANGTKLAPARKDKAVMQDRLRECGLPAAEQIRSSNLAELSAWAQARAQWPLVAKPVGSSGSDGVFFCNGMEDLGAAHAEVVGKMNPNGQVNADIVLQEFLAGTEYIVDTVSYAGQHICCAIWVYTKRKGTPWNPTCIVSEGNRLLPASGEIQDQLVSYVFSVLTAVGLKYGPCHTEVMLTPRGPILVEVNARLHGLQGPHLIGLATGTSQQKYAVDAIVGGGRLITQQMEASRPERWRYPMQKACLQMVLISPVEGYLMTSIIKDIEEMQLPSVVEVLPSLQKGQYLRQTCDLNTAAGYVLLVHESGTQLEQDVKRIRAAEESGSLYRISKTPLPNSPLPSPASMRASPISSPRLQSVEKVEQLWEDDDIDLGSNAFEMQLTPQAGAIPERL